MKCKKKINSILPGFKGYYIIFIIFNLSFSSFSQDTKQNITITRSNVSVKELLRDISLQSGMNFSYNPAIIDQEQKISFHIKNGSLNEVMELFREKIPVDYFFIEGQIVLNQRKQVIKTELPDIKYFTLNGFISDKISGESLIGAIVALSDRTKGAYSNEFGYYSLKLPSGKYKMQFSYMGFITEIAEIDLFKDQKIDIGLQSIPRKLPEIVIELPVSGIQRKNQPGITELSQNELKNMPKFGGSSDLIKGLQARPGVKTHSDGSAFYYVRGGEKDQNLLIIDDAPIYNPAHLFGFYSVVVPDFTRSVQLYSSDIPVNLGDRLSSVLDIRTKDGNLKKFELSGSTSLIMNQLSIEGPIVKEKSSFFTSLRLSNFYWLYKNFAPEINLAFGDFSFKWNYKADSKNRFFFTLINGRDQLENAGNSNSGIRWNNFAMTVRWNHIFSPQLFSNTTLYTGNYQYQLSYAKELWHSGIGNLSLKSDFTWYNSNALSSRFGLEFHGYFFNPGKILQGSFYNLFPVIKQDHSRQSVIYYSLNYKISDKWNLNSGVRMSVWSNVGPAKYYTFDEGHNLNKEVNTSQGIYKKYLRAGPRLSAIYNIDSTSFFKSSYSLNHQFLNLISNSTSPFSSFEVWLPASPNIKPQEGHIFSFGYDKRFLNNSIELTADVFYKIMKNQIDYKSHPNTLLNPLIEGELRFGRMRSYGLELTAKKDQGKVNGWISYSYSRALRTTPEVNGGLEYPAFHDRPHSFSALLNYNLTGRFMFSIYYTLFTGSAFSSPTGFYRFNDVTIPFFGEKNNDRLPAYKRMDIALKYILNKKQDNKYQHNLTFSVYNLLANKNIVDVNFNKTTGDNNSPLIKADLLAHQDLVVTRTMLIRFLPSLTYEFRFR